MNNPAMEDSSLIKILKNTKSVAVVGLSPDEGKPSNRVAQSLRHWGYKVIPVNPNACEVFGLRCWPNLAFVPERVDLVVVFRRPEHAAMVLAEASVRGVPSIWFQPGTSGEGIPVLAERRRITCVAGRCIQEEYIRLFCSEQ